jgi:hypothetical protein
VVTACTAEEAYLAVTCTSSIVREGIQAIASSFVLKGKAFLQAAACTVRVACLVIACIPLVVVSHTS